MCSIIVHLTFPLTLLMVKWSLNCKRPEYILPQKLTSDSGTAAERSCYKAAELNIGVDIMKGVCSLLETNICVKLVLLFRYLVFYYYNMLQMAFFFGLMCEVNTDLEELSLST